MSFQSLTYVHANLATLRGAAYTDDRGRRCCVLSGDGMALLILLAGAANNKADNTLYFTQDTMHRYAHVSTTQVKRLLVAFEQLGWIRYTGEEAPRDERRGKGTPVIQVLLGWSSDSAEPDTGASNRSFNVGSGSVKSPPAAPKNRAKSKRGKASTDLGNAETINPKPETLNAQPSATDPGPGGGGLDVHRYEQVVDKCLAIEAKRYSETHSQPIGPNLRQKWRRALVPHIDWTLEAMDDPNCADVDTDRVAHSAHANYLAEYLANLSAQRRPAMGSGASRGRQGCPYCYGTGTIAGEPDSTGPGVPRPCPCRERAAG